MYKITKTKKVAVDNPTSTYSIVLEYQHGDADGKSVESYLVHEDNLYLPYLFAHFVSKYDSYTLDGLTKKIEKAKGSVKEELIYEQLAVAMAYEDDWEDIVHPEVDRKMKELFDDSGFCSDYFKVGYCPEYDMFCDCEAVLSEMTITYFDKDGVEFDVNLKRK